MIISIVFGVMVFGGCFGECFFGVSFLGILLGWGDILGGFLDYFRSTNTGFIGFGVCRVRGCSGLSNCPKGN